MLISFGTPDFRLRLKRLAETARRWFDEIRLYGPDDLSDEWKAKHRLHLGAKKGAGLWAWKPEIIGRTLSEMTPGDFLMYCDARLYFIADPEPLYELGEIVLFHQKREKHVNKTWTKGDCFHLMSATDDAFLNGDNLVAGTQCYRAGQKASAFVAEYGRWCDDFQIVSDAPNRFRKNEPGFKAHRHDQSILSILRLHHRLPAFNDITQFGLGGPQDRRGGRIVQIDRRMQG